MPLPCCGAKGGAGNNPCLAASMEETKVPKMDSIFEKGAGVLKKAEAIRSGVEDTKADMMVLSGAHTFKDGKLTDALTIFLASVGTDNGADKLVAPAIDLKASPPCKLDFPSDCKMSDDHKGFKDALMCYVQTLTSAPDALKALTDELQEVIKEAQEASGTLKDDATEAGLGGMDAMKAVANAGKNSKALANGASKLGALAGTVTSAATDAKDLGAGGATCLTAAKDLAGKADKAKSKMTDIAASMPNEKLKAGEEKKTSYHTMRNARIEDGRALPSGEAAAEGDAPAEKKEEAAEEKKDEPASPEAVKAEIADV